MRVLVTGWPSFRDGEEELLALDLAAAGWWMCWAEDVVIHHEPSPSRDAGQRRRLGIRNTLWTLGLRRPPRWSAPSRWSAPHRQTPPPPEPSSMRWPACPGCLANAGLSRPASRPAYNGCASRNAPPQLAVTSADPVGAAPPTRWAERAVALALPVVRDSVHALRCTASISVATRSQE